MKKALLRTSGSDPCLRDISRRRSYAHKWCKMGLCADVPFFHSSYVTTEVILMPSSVEDDVSLFPSDSSRQAQLSKDIAPKTPFEPPFQGPTSAFLPAPKDSTSAA
jgi:hypothetical protein